MRALSNQSLFWMLAVSAFLVLVPKSALADLRVTFIEAAPMDRLIFENETQCDFGSMGLTLELMGSAGRLLFDTTPGGAGLNVAQPVKVETGSALLAAPPQVADGDEVLVIAVTQMNRKASIVLTADLDDRLEAGPMGQTMIAGAEIAGAVIRAQLADGEQATAEFDASGQAVLRLKGCQQMSTLGRPLAHQAVTQAQRTMRQAFSRPSNF